MDLKVEIFKINQDCRRFGRVEVTFLLLIIGTKKQ